MKNLTTPIFSAVVVLLMATGCSQQRYAHVRKVRVNQEASAPEKKQATEAFVQPEMEDEPFIQEALAIEEAPLNGIISEPAEGATATTAPATNRILEAPAKRVSKVMQPMIERAAKKLKPTEAYQDQLDTQSTWARLIIIGLIILLIGILVGVLVHGPLGWALYTVGAILMIIGLVLWLVSIL